jgi:predicted ribosome quality control (RQC) complex YloA/Tae2 family protein
MARDMSTSSSSSSPRAVSENVDGGDDISYDVMEYGTSGMWEEEEEGDDAKGDDAEDDESSNRADDFTQQQPQHDQKAEDSQQSLLYNEYQAWTASVEKSLTWLSKKQGSLQKELEKAASLESMVQRAELLKTYMYLFTNGVTSASFQDWSRRVDHESDDEEEDPKLVELTLDPDYDGSASAEANALFQQAKKLKRGSQIVQNLLQDTTSAMSVLAEIQSDLQSCCGHANDIDKEGIVDENRFRFLQDRLVRVNAQQPALNFLAPTGDNDTKLKQQHQKTNRQQQQQQQGKSKAKPTLGTPASNIRKFTSPSGCTVLVGRNRRGNDYLTFSIAKGNDIWMQ